MELKANVLIVSEESSLYDKLKSSSIKNICTLYFCKKQENLFSLIKNNNIQIVIMTSDEDESWEFKLLKMIKTFDPMIDVVIVGDPVSSEKVMEWINLGANDYLINPLQIDTIQMILRRFNEKSNLRRETYLLEKKLEEKYLFQGMVSKNPFMLEIFSLIENCAKYFSTVLITGDTGTGKEMVARAIHNLCPVKNKKFVVCDCASMPENLLESELFGYVRGAFTGADKNKKGLFEEAHEGIIFLDEIGETPVSFQAKLLRVLESHQFRPLGSNSHKKVDVRVIAASNRDLWEGIKEGFFREDLFHRLNKVEIHLPPLQKRLEDVPLLVRFFLNKSNKRFDKQIKGVSRELQKLFLTYKWPGNVRELENVVESASMLCNREFIDIIDLPKYLRKYISSNGKNQFFNRNNLSSLRELEKQYITYLLKKNNNNIRKTAKILDISRTTLYSKLNKYTINIPPS